MTGQDVPGQTLSFHHLYGVPVLSSFGPLLLGSWSISPDLEKALIAQGTVPPGRVAGAILLDTGASMTCISIKAAQTLRLKPTRTMSIKGAGGRRDDHPVFGATIHLPIKGPAGEVLDVFSTMETAGLPELEAHAPVQYAGGRVEIIGLLGRDLLRFTQFLYDGEAGSLRLRFNIAALKTSGMGGTVVVPGPAPPAKTPKGESVAPAPPITE